MTLAELVAGGNHLVLFTSTKAFLSCFKKITCKQVKGCCSSFVSVHEVLMSVHEDLVSVQ